VLTRAQKEAQVTELRDRFARATSVFVADYRGLDVSSVEKLRNLLWEQGGKQCEYQVMKNTLLRLAASGSQVEALTPHFSGPTAIALSYGDPVRFAKTLWAYSEQHEAFGLRAALFDGRALERSQIAALATLPTLEVARARLIGLLQAPAGQLVRLLVAPASQMARVVEARRQKLAEGGAT